MRYKGRVTLSDIPSDEELREILEAFMNFEDVDGWDAVIPQDAIDWLSEYVPKLAGKWSTDVLERVREVIRASMLEGMTLQERMKALQEVSPELLQMR